MTDTTHVEMPGFIRGDHALRCQTDRFAPELQRGDLLAVEDADTAEPGQLVMVEVDGHVGIERYEAGVEVRGLVVGFSRRLVDA